ncbi:ATP-binding protein [Saccharospirillum impatiens]|uniref:ATP-binding protein n=1 Tax=Saccharospirillum impatiens TaxID=169438 RepID=UPI000400AAF0|nr:ATP-binding protein [Saccharospirillum impatiens]
MTQNTKIRARQRDAVVQALRAGVAPAQGIQFLQVAREKELEAIIRDMERIEQGGASFRLVSGEYGAGKTFLLHLARQIALKKKIVTMHADLSPNRRLVASAGQARALYSELVSNMSTQSKPEGGALANVIERFVGEVMHQAEQEGGSAEAIIQKKLAPLHGYVGGFEITNVLQKYCTAHEQGDDEQKEAAMRWLRGEYGTKTEARQALGVRSIIDDSMLFDALKLLAHFMSIAGYGGILVIADEAVNLYKITNTTSRQANYEKVLQMLNATLQGEVRNIGIMFGITPRAVDDPRRGLFSYEALASRLRPNEFAKQAGVTDFNHPVITLPSLTQEELYVLLSNIRNIFAGGDESKYLLPDEALSAFMAHCQQKIGSAYFKTPRETARQFVNLLSILEQHPEMKWHSLIDEIEIEPDTDPQDEIAVELYGDGDTDTNTPANGSDDDDLKSFKM